MFWNKETYIQATTCCRYQPRQQKGQAPLQTTGGHSNGPTSRLTGKVCLYQVGVLQHPSGHDTCSPVEPYIQSKAISCLYQFRQKHSPKSSFISFDIGEVEVKFHTCPSRDFWVTFWWFWVVFITSVKDLMFFPGFIYLFVVYPTQGVPVKLAINLRKGHNILSVKWPVMEAIYWSRDCDIILLLSFCLCLLLTQTFPPMDLHSTLLLTFTIN